MKNLIIVIAIILLSVLLSCNKDSSSGSDNNNKKDTVKNTTKAIEDLLVKNNEISGWPFSGASWTASNSTELTDRIDGGAEIYIGFGFVEASQQVYNGKVNNAQTEITVTIYNQGSLENSAKVYNDPQITLLGGTSWKDAGESAQYARYNGLSQELIFYRGKYFVRLSSSADSDESLNILQQFARNVDSKILN